MSLMQSKPCASVRPSFVPQQRCFRSCRVNGKHFGSGTSDVAVNGRADVRVHVGRNLGTQIIGGGLGGSNEIFVAGADSQLGVRIVQKLLQAGFKVAAGVNDEEQAQNVIDFATSVELLKKQEVQKLRLTELNLADPESIDEALPSRARIVVVVSDSSTKGTAKIDGKVTTRILQAAQDNDAQQFVLVTPAGSAGGGGFFGNLFGSPSVGGSGRKPSKVEQAVASSGLDFVVIRTGKTDVTGSEFEESNNVALGPQGSLPAKSNISKAQVADVVQQILRQADSDVLIEAWAGPQEPESNIEDLVAQALPAATIEEEEDDEEEESPIQAAQEVAEEADVPEEVKKPARSLFGGFGTRKIKATPADEEDEEPAAPPTPAAKRRPTPPAAKRPAASAKRSASDDSTQTGTQRVGLFGFGKGKAEEEEEEEEPAPKSKGFFGLGGKKQSQEEEEDEPPAKPQRGFLGIGGKKPQEDEEEKEAPSPSPLKSLFGGKKNESADISPDNARNSAARGIKAVGKAASSPPARKQRPTPAAKKRGASQEEEKPQKKGFLSSIGFDTEKYTYEEDD